MRLKIKSKVTLKIKVATKYQKDIESLTVVTRLILNGILNYNLKQILQRRRKMDVLQKSFRKVNEHFYGDMVKTWEWFKAPQNAFSGKSPMDLIRSGSGKKVINFINKNMR